MIVRLWIVGLVFCIIQVSILRVIAVCQVTPNIVLAFVVYASLFYNRTGMWVGFGTGLFIDMYSYSPGWNALMGTLIGYGLGVLSHKVYKETVLLWLILLFLSSLLYEVVIFASLHQLSGRFFLRYIVLGAIYTTLVGLIMFHLFRRIRI